MSTPSYADLQAEVARWKALGADSPEAMAKLLASQRLCAQLREQLLKDSEAEAEVARLTAECDRLREAFPEAADVITNACQIIDVTKIEWGEAWSTWDQSVRDAASEWLKKYYVVAEK